MCTYHVVVYVGPCIVADMACKIRGAGVAVTCEGTERIHCIVDTPDGYLVGYTFLERLRATYGHTFGFTVRDVITVRMLEHATEKSFSK